jgi:hypothetical protein
MANIPVKIYEPARPAANEAAPTLGVVGDFVGRLVGRSDTMSSDALQHNLHNFLAGFGDALTGVPHMLSGYHIDEIELSLEISASGEFSFWSAVPRWKVRRASNSR